MAPLNGCQKHSKDTTGTRGVDAGADGNGGTPGANGGASGASGGDAGGNGGDATACEPPSAGCPPVPQACKPRERSCQDGNVYLCNANGVGSTLAQRCPPERPCQSSYRPFSYDKSQSGPGGADCLPPFEDVPCAPNAYRCLTSAILARCNETGSSSDLVASCVGQGFRCSEGTCIADFACSRGKACLGNVLFDCVASGLGGTGVDCGDDAHCEEGECRPNVCTPNAVSVSCADNRAEHCDERGSGATISTMCWLGELCDESNGDPHCAKHSCAPGSTACIANQVGMCGEDSSSLAAVSTDCAAMGRVCDTAGGCSDSVVDAMGSDIASDSADFIGNVVCVDSTRRLTQLEAALTLVDPAELDWRVFKLIRGDITLDRDIPRVSEIELVGHASGMYEAGTEFFGSDPLDVLLEAGTCYLLAVQGPRRAPGAGQPDVQLAHYDDSPQPERQLSFGHVVGGARYSFRTDIEVSLIYHMRATTELP